MNTDARPWMRTSRGAPAAGHCQVVDLGADRLTTRRLIVVQGATIRLIPLDSIQWMSAGGEMLRLHLTTGELSTPGSLASVTETLGPGFLRINRNVTVNLSAVDEIRRRSRRGESVVVLRDRVELPVTRRYAPLLRDCLSGKSSLDHRQVIEPAQPVLTRMPGGIR
jgi:DNA-binding LytR/AlgR family response regulator